MSQQVYQPIQRQRILEALAETSQENRWFAERMREIIGEPMRDFKALARMQGLNLTFPTLI